MSHRFQNMYNISFFINTIQIALKILILKNSLSPICTFTSFFLYISLKSFEQACSVCEIKVLYPLDISIATSKSRLGQAIGTLWNLFRNFIGVAMNQNKNVVKYYFQSSTILISLLNRRNSKELKKQNAEFPKNN